MTTFEQARPVVETLVQQAIAANYSVSVFDSEEWSTIHSYNKDEILKDIFGVEEVFLAFHTTDLDKIGQVFIILDNGEDAIVDYSYDSQGRMENLMNRVNKLIDNLQCEL